MNLRAVIAAGATSLVVLAGCSSPTPVVSAAQGSADIASWEAANGYATTSSAAAPSREVVPSKFYQGSGDDVVDVGTVTAAAILTFSCPACTSNVALKTDGSEGLLVNTIGAYSGSHFINLRDNSVTSTLTINAVGAWTVEIEDAFLFAPHDSSGHGDAAIFLDGPGTKATITNKGQSNFAVEVLSGDGFDLAVNEIGSYHGTVPMTFPALVQVTSSGSWSIIAG